ncbi:hypothetical protein DPEC_G00248970 [Dallia pectoralis]|uniref:Uncharacterized protein n=1 Tax=Dallia pectoralis TaxID=75939 RepID=A0ACC2FSU4_DALPE|nr:hypothetical protein DPEC_G00248970 [Dallia pectoralis]
MEKVLAKALYDNKAECSDELGFRRGDVLTVLQQEVDSSSGWWICSLYGQRGLAPANRLQLLPQDPPSTQTRAKGTGFMAGVVDPARSHNSVSDEPGNIYQIPSGPRHSWTSSPTYEQMASVYTVPSTDDIYKVSSLPGLDSPRPAQSPCYVSTQKQSPDGIETSASSEFSGCSDEGEVYDVPRCRRQAYPFPICPVPAAITPDPNYDIPVPSLRSYTTPQPVPFILPSGQSNNVGGPKTQPCGSRTLPNPRKSDWIYDVPNSPERPGGQSGLHTTIPSAGQNSIYTNLPFARRTSIYTTLPSAGQTSIYTTLPSAGQTSIYTTLPSAGHTSNYTTLPSAGHTSNYTTLPSAGQTSIYTTLPSAGHTSNYTTLPSAGHTSNYTTLPSAGQTSIYTTLPSAGHTSNYNTLSPGGQRGNCGSLPSEALSFVSDGTLPIRVHSGAGVCSSQSIYDIPKPSGSLLEQFSVSVPHRGHHIPLECRGDSGSTYNHPSLRGGSQRGRMGLVAGAPRDWPGRGDTLLQEEEEDEERGKTTTYLSEANDKQRISTASTTSSSSSSSCDSMALCFSSSEMLREVSLSQEEACRRLFLLQQEVCREVTHFMDFVSSQWRSRKHLEKHLTEIRSAAEGVASSVSSFLTFALDMKGNAQRLTDSNLRSRLQGQLSVIEDSGLILQQAVCCLNQAGWPLHLMVQDLVQNHTPDQLDRLVMVTRTVPEDIKRLVSIVYANAKLLFRPKEQETVRPDENNTSNTSTSNNSTSNTSTSNTSTSNTTTSTAGSENKILVKDDQEQDGSASDDNEYVQLQTKKEFENQQIKGMCKEKINKIPSMKPKEDQTMKISEHHVFIVDEQVEVPRRIAQDQVSLLEIPEIPSVSQLERPRRQSSLSQHCRLYFGALQKALGVLVTSLLEGQPPEKFISHSKLVILVGQRLVEALCREAHGTTREAKEGEPGPVLESGPGQNQVLLCNTNHLCAQLKQLAMATKKAVLHYPEKQALLEVQDFAKELAQRAQHFRISLDL